jgi:LysM domain
VTDRPRSHLAIPLAIALVLALVATACLPDAVGPQAPSGPPGPATPTARPTPSGPTPVPTFVPPTPTPGPTFLTYTVVRGDSLTSIAKRFNTKARSIAFWNRAAHPSLDPEGDEYSPNRIELGWVLVLIPGAMVDEEALPSLVPIPVPPTPSPKR